MADNPDINVILDNVAYQVVQEQLPIQLEAGQGPDIARVTNLKEQAQHWLDLTPYLTDPDYWRTNFADTLDWMRPDGSTPIPGFMTQLTLTGGFANTTLFEQAGVAAARRQGATWDDWVDASAKVARQPDAARRLRHRPLRPPHLRPGHLLRRQLHRPGRQPGAGRRGRAQAFVEKLVGWTEEGKMLKDIWVSAAGSTYRAAAEDFINAQIAFYYSGSWQVANFATKIGDAFDWVATGRPAAPPPAPACQGGAALVAIKYTKNPEEVAKVMEYLGQRADGEGVHRAHAVPAGPQGRHRQGRPGVQVGRSRRSSRRCEKFVAGRRLTSRPLPPRCRPGSGRTPTTPRSSPASAR